MLTKTERLRSTWRAYRVTARRQRQHFPGVLWLEIIHALGLSWWIDLFLLPGSLFATNPSFNGLAVHAPEWEWCFALILVLSGVLAGMIAPYPLLRFLGLSGAAGAWAAIAVCLAYSAPYIGHTPVNTGVGIYGSLSLVTAAVAVCMGNRSVRNIESALRRGAGSLHG